MKKIFLLINLLLVALSGPASLPQLTDTMGLVSIPVASLRTRGAHAAEMSTQAVMGTPVAIRQHKGEWYEAVTPEGYVAWIPESSGGPETPAGEAAWGAKKRRYVGIILLPQHPFTPPPASAHPTQTTDIPHNRTVRSGNVGKVPRAGP